MGEDGMGWERGGVGRVGGGVGMGRDGDGMAHACDGVGLAGPITQCVSVEAPRSSRSQKASTNSFGNCTLVPTVIVAAAVSESGAPGLLECIITPRSPFLTAWHSCAQLRCIASGRSAHSFRDAQCLQNRCRITGSVSSDRTAAVEVADSESFSLLCGRRRREVVAVEAPPACSAPPIGCSAPLAGGSASAGVPGSKSYTGIAWTF